LPALLGGDGCQLGLLQLITGVRVISQVDLCADEQERLVPSMHTQLVFPLHTTQSAKVSKGRAHDTQPPSNANNCRGNKTYSLFDAFKRVVMRRDNAEAKQEQMRALIEELYV
jgi:hypothetical protein